MYIKGLEGMDDSHYYIRKVQFRLHESYPNNVRMVEKPPFELTETGWGEFDIQVVFCTSTGITVIWHDF